MTGNSLLIAGAAAIILAFGLLVWPGMWEYQTVDGKSYRINRLSGSIQVFDPVKGYVKPTPTPGPAQVLYISVEYMGQAARTACQSIPQTNKAEYEKCFVDALDTIRKTRNKNEEEVKAGRAVYVYPGPEQQGGGK
jgi:hypothetical protein